MTGGQISFHDSDRLHIGITVSRRGQALDQEQRVQQQDGEKVKRSRYAVVQPVAWHVLVGADQDMVQTWGLLGAAAAVAG